MDNRHAKYKWHPKMGTGSGSRGFTLIEVMVVVVIIAIVAAIAMPAYQDYIVRSRARTAAADLMSLGTAFENRFQRQLSYSSSAVSTGTTAATANLVIGWQPSSGDFFTYTATVAASTYDLTASGTGAMSGCTITLAEDNAKSTSEACGISSSW